MTQPVTTDRVTHTLGPWSACRDGDCRCGLVWGADGETVVALANSPHYRGFELSDSIPNVEAAKANAKLIAKAPQLLATLKDVVAHLRSFTLDPGEGEDDAPALTAAEALIAETEGCEP